MVDWVGPWARLRLLVFLGLSTWAPGVIYVSRRHGGLSTWGRQCNFSRALGNDETCLCDPGSVPIDGMCAGGSPRAGPAAPLVDPRQTAAAALARCTTELGQEVARRGGQSYHKDVVFSKADAARSCNASCGLHARGLADDVCPTERKLPPLGDTPLPPLQTICFATHHTDVFESHRTDIESAWQRGHVKAGKMRLLIAGLIRDGADSLHPILVSMTRLGAHFADFKIVILENDSSDDTALALQKLSQEFPHMTYQSLSLNTSGDRVGKGTKMRDRVRRMAHARNLLLKLIGDTMVPLQPDVVAVVDMDLGSASLVPFELDMALVTLGREELSDGFDLVCANSLRRYANYHEVGHHDVFALRDDAHLTMDRHWAIEFDNPHAIARNLFKQFELIPVRSCFGGLALYNPAAFCGCEYDEELDDCEHVSFHRCMTCRNMTRMFVDPLLVTRYESHLVIPQECVRPGQRVQPRPRPRTEKECLREGGHSFIQCGGTTYCCNHLACQSSHKTMIQCNGLYLQGCVCHNTTASGVATR